MRNPGGIFMETSELVFQTGRKVIALIERQLAELSRGERPDDGDERFEEASLIFGPYARALLAHSSRPQPTQPGSVLDDDEFGEPGLGREAHYARQLLLSREAGCTEWDSDAEVIRLARPPLRRAS